MMHRGRVFEDANDLGVDLELSVELPAHRCIRLSTIATLVMNARKMSASRRREDLKRLEVISFFVPALVRAFLLAEALAPPVVRLIEAPRDRAVALLVVAAPARFAPGWFHAWGGGVSLSVREWRGRARGG